MNLRTGIRASALLSGLLAAQLLASAASIDFDVLRRIAAERFGARAQVAVDAWESLNDQLEGQQVPAQLRAINQFFNQRARWESDQQIHRQEDYWATPLELLAIGAGDCEDFAVAKYVSLLATGVAPETLRLVYVTATLASGLTQAHMVLTWYSSPQAEPLVLDNINPQILPAGRRPDLVPIFSFSATELWVAGRSKAVSSKPIERMSRWRDLLDRAVAEGFRPEW
ncbi:MAG: transglutaminase-like cysteine peptidase [Pseudomonadota bacterium]